MADLPGMLRARARRVIPGRAYNEHRRAVADREERLGLPATSFYEAALPPARPAQALAAQVMPAFARFARARGLDPARPRGLTVAVFLGEDCFLLEAGDLVACYCEVEGISSAAFAQRAATWAPPGT